MAGLVQIWAPLLQWSPFDEAFARDLLRAQRAWQGEDRLWLRPGAPAEVKRWVLRPEDVACSECLIQAETFNRIHVVNIDESRRVFPPIGAAVPSSSGHAG